METIMTDTCDIQQLAEEVEILSNETMTLKDLGKIDLYSYDFADEIENLIGYDANDIRKGNFNGLADTQFVIRFVTLLLYFRKRTRFEITNQEFLENVYTFDRHTS